MLILKNICISLFSDKVFRDFAFYFLITQFSYYISSATDNNTKYDLFTFN